MAKRDPVTIERELNGARAQFALMRATLASALVDFGAREGAQDRLINFADEFGVEHALETMAKTPDILGLSRAAKVHDIAEMRHTLASAYAQNHKVDRLLAERETLLREEDPTRAKAIMVGGREAEFDGASLRFRDNGATETVTLEKIEPTADHEDENEDERSR